MALNQDTTVGLPYNTGGTLALADPSTVADGVFVIDVDGEKWERVFDGGNSIFRASWLFNTGAPTNKTALVNIALASSAIKTLEIDTDISIDGAVTTTKTLKFLNGGIINGTGTLTTPKIDADYNQQIFGSSLVVVNPKSATGKFSAQWWGVVADGTTDNTANINRVANSVATSYQKNILFPGSQLNYLISGTATIASDIILSFDKGAVLDIAGSLNGGIIDAMFTQQIFTPTSIVNPSATKDKGTFSVMWLGATGNGATNDHPAIQASCDLVVRNNLLFRTVWFPNGTYKIDDPIIVYKWSGTAYAQHTVYLEGECSFWPSASIGAKINTTYKDTFGIGIQLGKGCKVKNIFVNGLFTPPFTGANYGFFSCSFDDYIDPTCSSDRYAPYSGIVIDPFSNSASDIPPGGGYAGLSNYYRGTGSLGGSTGVEIEDVVIGNFTVCLCSSPNSFTSNSELHRIEKFQFFGCQLGISGCEDQEKVNTVNHFACWSNVHTVFATGKYGARRPGNWYISNGNLAGNVNTFIDNVGSNFYPVYIKEVFAESLGKWGTMTGTLGSVVSNSNINFSILSVTKTVQYNILSDGSNTLFKSCVLRYYGQLYPISIKGTALFEECSFTAIPFTSGTDNDLNGNPLFVNCTVSGFPFGRIGNYGRIPNSNGLTSTSPYGNYNYYNAGLGVNNGRFGYKYDNYVHSVSIALGTFSIAVTGGDRQFTFTLSLSELYRVDLDRVVTTSISGTVTPIGLVTAINAGTGEVTVSYAHKDLVDGSTILTVVQPLYVGSTLLADSTVFSANLTNVKIIDGLNTQLVGKWIKSDIHIIDTYKPYVKILSYTSGTSTIVTSTTALYTRTANFFSNFGKQFHALESKNMTLSTSKALQKGGVVSMVNYNGTAGISQDYIIMDSGYLDPSAAADTRRAYIFPVGTFLYSGNPEGTVNFPAGALVRDTATGDLYIKTTTNSAALNGGNVGWVKQSVFVVSGTQYQLAYYAATGSAVSGLTAITASRALKSDANGLPIAFDIATEPSLTELSYVKGVTSAIQTQLNAKISSASIVSGLYAVNGDGILTTFTVTHGFTGTPTNVQVTPAGVDSALLYFVNNITATTFDVTFTTPPIIGTNNVTFYWTVK